MSARRPQSFQPSVGGNIGGGQIGVKADFEHPSPNRGIMPPSGTRLRRLMARLGLAALFFAAILLRAEAAEPRGELLAGFAAVDLTPKLAGQRVYLAGYGLN